MLETLRNVNTEVEIRQILSKIMQEDFLDKWMVSSIPYFDNEKPVDMIKAGKINRIKMLIHYLASGVRQDD